MSAQTQRTPEPWEYQRGPRANGIFPHRIVAHNGVEVARLHSSLETEARNIVRARNAHDDLVAALRQIVIEATESPNSDTTRLEIILEQARAALAKVTA